MSPYWSRIPLMILDRLQRILDFKTCSNANFKSDVGLGRVATIALFLGSLLSSNCIILGLLYMYHFHIIQIAFLHSLINQHRFQVLVSLLWYQIGICFFHLVEFFITALFNPSSLSASSFLINHSLAYTAAYLLSLLEWGFRFLLCPTTFTTFSILQGLGILLVVVGQSIRTLSMVTCGDNFNHFIQTTPTSHHKLVTWGIYRYLRHPSYVGFFYWCIGMQFMLGNPVCSVLFTIAARSFFHQRIAFEERLLLQQYGQEYFRYRQTTFLGIP